jgi:hypothetical protein
MSQIVVSVNRRVVAVGEDGQLALGSARRQTRLALNGMGSALQNRFETGLCTLGAVSTMADRRLVANAYGLLCKCQSVNEAARSWRKAMVDNAHP